MIFRLWRSLGRFSSDTLCTIIVIFISMTISPSPVSSILSLLSSCLRVISAPLSWSWTGGWWRLLVTSRPPASDTEQSWPGEHRAPGPEENPPELRTENRE